MSALPRKRGAMMQSRISFKRKRGGQPGNKNAAGNRGNRSARGKLGNRGGGAPFGNQNARKRSKSPLEFLQREYAHSPEAVEWLRRHAAELNQADFTDDDQRDAITYAAYRGLTPEALASQGREYQVGLYTLMEEAGNE
jgi:uncharacterized protein YjcR